MAPFKGLWPEGSQSGSHLGLWPPRKHVFCVNPFWIISGGGGYLMASQTSIPDASPFHSLPPLFPFQRYWQFVSLLRVLRVLQHKWEWFSFTCWKQWISLTHDWYHIHMHLVSSVQSCTSLSYSLCPCRLLYINLSIVVLKRKWSWKCVQFAILIQNPCSDIFNEVEHCLWTDWCGNYSFVS